MALDTNSQNVKECSLSLEKDPPIMNRNSEEDSVQNGTKSPVKKKIIVYFLLILSVACIGFVLLSEVSYHLPSMSSTNTSTDALIGTKDKDNNVTDCNMLDEVLLGERRARLEALKYRQLTQEQKIFWSRIHSAWNATGLSSVPMDTNILDFMIVLSMMKHIVGKATRELQEEGYELLHDLFLEEQQSQNQSDASMDWMCALGNFTDNIETTEYAPTLALKAFNVLAEGFNLYYQKIKIEKSQDDSNKFIFGKFVYRGKSPEKPYVTNVRHILNAIVRLHLKIENPSAMRTICGHTKLETESKKTENILFNYIGGSLNHSDKWYPSTVAAPAMRRKRSSISRFDSMEDPNSITSKRFQSSMEMFFDKMEILSSHIDRLHERYMTFNELNDDYISQEFSVESDFTDNGKI